MATTDKVCKVCQKPFTIQPLPGYFLAKMCSAECRLVAKRARSRKCERAKYGTQTGERTCPHCKATFSPVGEGGLITRRAYCTPECRKAARKDRPSRHYPRGEPKIPCSWCGKVFDRAADLLAGRPVKYCTEDCRRLGTEASKRRSRVRQCRGGEPVQAVVPCAECGREFDRSASLGGHGRPVVTCSDDCRLARGRRKVREYRLRKAGAAGD